MEDGHFNLAFEESVPQGGGTSDFNELINRPKYNGTLMTGNTNIPAVPTKTSDLTNDSDFVNQQALDTLEQELQGEIAEKQDQLTAGANITIENNVISATSGTVDYDDLENKPSIEGVTLEGNKTAAQLGLATATALAAEIGAREGADEVIEGNIETLSTAVSEHDTSIQNLENDVDALQSDVETLEGEVNSIEDVIPAQATASNQLADKAFVNSTVQTGTANFRGNWANWAAVPTDPTEYPADYTGTTTPSTNDYMVVQDASGYVDPTEVLAGTWRFKYTGVWSTDGRNGWHPEYQVNETPMTAAQLAALNSGATTALIEQITRNEDAISALDADKQDLLESGENIKTLNNTSLLGSGNITTNKVVEIGNGQYTYQGYVLPTISVTIARQVYTDDQAGISQVLHWSIYGTDNNLKVVSSDHIGTEYSIDVLVHNKYHCAYTWTDQTTGDIEPTVETSQHITIAQTTGQSTEAVMSQKAVTDALASAGGGGVKVLTTADYNWPTSNPDGIAIWKLETGFYENPDGLQIYQYSGSSTRSTMPFMITEAENYGNSIAQYAFDVAKIQVCVTDKSGNNRVLSSIPYIDSIRNNLTATSSGSVLDARQGKVLKDLIDSLIIKGSGAPTTSTVGTVGQLYEDTTNGALYQCTAVSGSAYTWETVGGGSGGGDVSFTDLFTDGSSQTEVKIGASAASGVVSVAIGKEANASRPADVAIGYKASASTGSPASDSRSIAIGMQAGNTGDQDGIAIGYNSSNNSSVGIAIGGYASTTGYKYSRAIALGGNATVNSGSSNRGGVAIGAYSGSNINASGMVDIGSSSTNYGYNNTNYRLLTGLHDGINAHDACTKGQLDAAVGNIETVLATLTTGTGA